MASAEKEREQTAWRYLNRAPLLHIDMTETLRRGIARLAAANDAGVLLVAPDGTAFLSAGTPGAAAGLCEGVAISGGVVHQAHSLPLMREKYGLQPGMVCHQVAWRGGALPPPPGVEMRPLGPEWHGFIVKHYNNKVGEDYITGRLNAGVMVGAFLGGEIAGFAGEHEEGAMGFLQVLPAFRRRGVAKALSAYLINDTLARGFTPYAQVEADNAVSLAMQRSMGMQISNELVYWC